MFNEVINLDRFFLPNWRLDVTVSFKVFKDLGSPKQYINIMDIGVSKDPSLGFIHV